MSRYIRCSTGEIVNNYSDYLKTEHWHKKKQSFKVTVVRECLICRKRTDLHVHHISYKNIGREKNGDLCLLCKDCHFGAHRQGKDKLDEIYQIRKNQRRMDIKRIKHGKDWLNTLGFSSEEEYLINVEKQRDTNSIKSKEGLEEIKLKRKKCYGYLKEKYIRDKKINNWHYFNKRRNQAIRVSQDYYITMKNINTLEVFNNDKKLVEKIHIKKNVVGNKNTSKL